MADDVQRADEDARLLVEAFCLGQQNPAIWAAYMTGWESDVLRRIKDRFPDAGIVPQPGGSDPSVGPAPLDSDPEHEGNA